MDGNGAMHPIKPWNDCNPFCAPADLTGFLDSLINVLGMNLHRFFLYGCKFSPSPGEYVVYDGMREFFEQAQRLDSIAEANNEFYGTCPAVLGPPKYMKVNNKCSAGIRGGFEKDPDNILKTDHYDDFGEYCATFLRTVVDTFGITPYAFSFQNEPCFNVEWESAVYRDGEHYRDMFKVAAPIVGALGLPTLIYTTEHMAWNHPIWENVLRDDPVCAPYVHRDAVHGYQVDAETFDPTAFSGKAQPVAGTPLWMSETGFPPGVDTYDGAILAAKVYYGAYKYSRMSAWIHLKVMAGSDSDGWRIGFVDPTSGRRFPTYWATAQYWRFVRPGMQRIEANSTNDSVRVVAFKDDRVSSMSVIMLNETATDQTVHLNITGGDAPPRFDVRRTTPTENFVMLGTVLPTDAISVPAKGIVSLGYNYIGTGVPPGKETQVVRHLPNSVVSTPKHDVRIYDLRGRLVSRNKEMETKRLLPGSVSAAAYCVDNGVRRSLLITR